MLSFLEVLVSVFRFVQLLCSRKSFQLDLSTSGFIPFSVNSANCFLCLCFVCFLVTCDTAVTRGKEKHDTAHCSVSSFPGSEHSGLNIRLQYGLGNDGLKGGWGG